MFFCDNESSPWNKFCRGAELQLMLQRAHRYGYDHAMFFCGSRVTEVVTLKEEWARWRVCRR